MTATNPIPSHPLTWVQGGKGIDRTAIGRILIRGTNWVGDAVMTLPALEAVREIFPSGLIAVLAKPWVAPIYERHPAVDQVLLFEKGEGTLNKPVQMIQTVRLVREGRFDLAILFQNAFEAALLTRLAGIGLRIGYNTDGRGLLLTHPIIRTKEVVRVHQTEYYLSLLRAMGWEVETRAPRLYMSVSDADAAKTVLQRHDIGDEDFLLGLAPGAAFGGAKRWPPERFAEIGDMGLREWGAKIVLFGSEGERGICARVRRTMKLPALDLSGRTSLGTAMALIGRCSLFVTNDSGLMHVAAALNVPTVAIFGPTDPVATGPVGLYTKIVRHDTACAPCLRPECTENHACMLGVRVEEVWETMVALREEIE
jgi:heptosyltransferase II